MNMQTDNALPVLLAQLEAAHSNRDKILTGEPSNEEAEAVINEHWDARAKIQRIKALTLGDVKLKIRAAEIAAEAEGGTYNDTDADGGFVHIVDSIFVDIRALAA